MVLKIHYKFIPALFLFLLSFPFQAWGAKGSCLQAFLGKTPRIHSNRLIIEAITPDEIPQMEKYLDQPEEEALTFTGEDSKGPKAYKRRIKKEAHRASFGKWSYEKKYNNLSANLGVYLLTKGRKEKVLVGFTDLHYYRDSQQVSFGYLIATPWRGQGLATEVAQALMKYSMDHFQIHKDGFFVSIHEDNRASIRVMEKLGFIQSDMRDGENSHYYFHQEAG